MNMDQKLRNYAINDLKRFCDPAHYLFREYDPEADRLLAQPLMQKFASLGLTPREFDAAAALDAWATCQIRSRAIWATAYPAKDYGDCSESPGTTEHQDIEIRERFRMYREAALVYAKTLGDQGLIDAFQSATTTAMNDRPADDGDDQKRRNRLYQEVELIDGFELSTPAKIRSSLAQVAGTTKSCVVEVKKDSIRWVDGNGGFQQTSDEALQKWLSRHPSRRPVRTQS